MSFMSILWCYFYLHITPNAAPGLCAGAQHSKSSRRFTRWGNHFGRVIFHNETWWFFTWKIYGLHHIIFYMISPWKIYGDLETNQVYGDSTMIDMACECSWMVFFNQSTGGCSLGIQGMVFRGWLGHVLSHKGLEHGIILWAQQHREYRVWQKKTKKQNQSNKKNKLENQNQGKNKNKKKLRKMQVLFFCF